MSSTENFLRVPSKTTHNASGKEIDDDETKLSSRVTFSQESVGIEQSDSGEVDKLNGDLFTEYREVLANEDKREGWDNKMQFCMGVISYAVGLGNVWRFPYLCQKNGGGAFLVPYIIMMVVEGMPLFLIELGIGQRLQTGPVGVWNAIHPYLGGVGVSAAIVSFLVALYYNVIITWCIYYLFNSFTSELPWSTCPVENGTIVRECALAKSKPSFFWNRQATETSESIGEFEGFVYHVTISLVVAWFLIYLCVMRGIKSSGKVMYITATFPYLVTTIFLIRSIMLDGATRGLKYMLTPDLTRLVDPNVWLEAATQVFYSMGLGFGGKIISNLNTIPDNEILQKFSNSILRLIAFASYNPMKNNCKKDCVVLSFCNLLTSLYTALVVFCVLGYMGNTNYHTCLDRDMEMILEFYPGRFANLGEIKGNITDDEWIQWMQNNFHMTEFSRLANHTQHCDFHEIISQAAEGTGLAFVVFTEAILQFPFPPVWAVMFFLMLLMLGLGSMFGTLEGVITSLNDSNLITLKKPVFTAVLCSVACVVGLVFTTHAGQVEMSYSFNDLNDSVTYIYSFVRDLEFMTDQSVSKFWTITWRFISPVFMFVLFFASLAQSFKKLPTYFAYNKEQARQVATPYPPWALFIAFSMVAFAMAPVPVVWFIRKFKIWKVEMDIPAAQKCLGSTPSTTFMLKSQQSFNRMAESTASELQSIGVTNLSS
ncbi:unnamed protein product [Anisakis simplex]|uniref:Transporter n=1 Tax=Anisakis simplex TaxID=6269 RepID=A0A158PN82_ANISI|nr:unnamed protein product [Anisakis simplex]